MANLLSEQDKDRVIKMFEVDKTTIKRIAYLHGVSPRTIGRVLAERGLAGPITQVRENAMKLVQIMKDHGITSEAQMAVVLLEHKNGPAPSTVLTAMANMAEDEYNALLAQIIHLREAKKHNISVTGAMLKLERKAEANANDNKG